MSSLRAAYATFNDEEFEALCREAFGAYYVRGEDLREVAQTLGVPECDVMELADCVCHQLQVRAQEEATRRGQAQAFSVAEAAKSARLNSLENRLMELTSLVAKQKFALWLCAAVGALTVLGSLYR